MQQQNTKFGYCTLFLVVYMISPYCLAEGDTPSKPLPQDTMQGYCPVSYFTGNHAVKGNPKFQSRYLGEVYFFVDENAKKTFDSDPMRYLPQFAGLCTLSLGGPYGKRFPGDPQVFTIVDGKLYFFISERAYRAYQPRAESVLMRAHMSFAKPHIFGYSPVAYQKQKKATKGDPKYHAAYRRQVYHFGSEADRQLFIASPKKYAPQYAGYCAMSLAKGSRYYADPSFFAVVDDKTYLFLNQEMKDSFMLNPAKATAAADILWVGIRGASEH